MHKYTRIYMDIKCERTYSYTYLLNTHSFILRIQI